MGNWFEVNADSPNKTLVNDDTVAYIKPHSTFNARLRKWFLVRLAKYVTHTLRDLVHAALWYSPILA